MKVTVSDILAPLPFEGVPRVDLIVLSCGHVLDVPTDEANLSLEDAEYECDRHPEGVTQ